MEEGSGFFVSAYEDHVRRVLDEAPALSDDKRDKITTLFQSGGDPS